MVRGAGDLPELRDEGRCRRAAGLERADDQDAEALSPANMAQDWLRVAEERAKANGRIPVQITKTDSLQKKPPGGEPGGVVTLISTYVDATCHTSTIMPPLPMRQSVVAVSQAAGFGSHLRLE